MAEPSGLIKIVLFCNEFGGEHESLTEEGQNCKFVVPAFSPKVCLFMGSYEKMPWC